MSTTPVKQSKKDVSPTFEEKLPLIEVPEKAGRDLKLLGKFGALGVFILNCGGLASFTLHMTLSRVGLFWAVAISAGIVACNCYCINMLEDISVLLESENTQQNKIETSDDIVRLLNIPW